jgi:hypothetical protein
MSKEVKIGRPCSPSTTLSGDHLNVTEFKVSYGGGMGGANETFYALESMPRKDGLLRLTLRGGEDIDINPRFLVYKRPRVMVIHVVDTTAHANYRNKICEKQIGEYVYILKEGQKAIFVDEYMSHNDLPKCISKTTETT